MNRFGKTLIILFLAAMLASCSGGQSTPTVSDAEIMETAKATVSTALAETQRARPVATSTPLPTNTPIPPTETSIPPTPEFGVGLTLTSDKDGMTLVFVPAGEFTMGSDNGEPDEKPVHKVNVDAFWIDQTEVTNAMYAKCVADGPCLEPLSKSSSTHPHYYGNPEFDHYPVIYVDWTRAKAYCKWADRRLPTEAEWEKAARGDDERTYPWGNDAPNNNLLNYNGDTTEVGKYPDNASSYGVLDMAGNVYEWVADWYSDTYYQGSPSSNPLGSDFGPYRVMRGGSWNSIAYFVRSTYRTGRVAWHASDYIGFRCSLSP